MTVWLDRPAQRHGGSEFPAEAACGCQQRGESDLDRLQAGARDVHLDRGDRPPVDVEHRHGDGAGTGMELAVTECKAVRPDLLQRALQVDGAGQRPGGVAGEIAAADDPAQRPWTEGEQRLTHGRRVQGQPCRIGEQGARLHPGLLLDVGDLDALDHTEAGGGVQRGGEILHDERPTLAQRRRLRHVRHLTEAGTGPVGVGVGSFDERGTYEVVEQPVDRRHRQVGVHGELGQRVVPAVRERDQDGGELARDRPTRLVRVPRHPFPPSAATRRL